jgi:nitroreductase
MKSIDRNQLLEHLKWRYATKQFDPARKIPAADWEALEHSLVLSPSSYGLQPWKFIVVTDQATREKMVPVSWGQKQVAECSHFVVFAVKNKLGEGDVDNYIKRITEVRGGAAEAWHGFRDIIVGDVIKGARAAMAKEWAARQAYIALGNFMTCAALLGIDTCPMEGFEPPKYDEILGLPARGLSAVVACATGYRSQEDKYAKLPKVRFEASQVIERV